MPSKIRLDALRARRTALGLVLSLGAIACSSATPSNEPGAGAAEAVRGASPSEATEGAAGSAGTSEAAATEGAAPTSNGPGSASNDARVCTTVAPLPAPTGPVLYVATTGSDSTGNGTATRPFASIARAAARARPGDTIVVRGGVYSITREQYIGARGNAQAPIVIRAASGERPILDGASATLDGTFQGDRYRGLVTLGGSYLVLDGFEVRNSVASGLKLYQADHVVLRNNVVHDIAEQALGGSGDDVTLEGNEVYRAAMNNENGAVDKRNNGWGWSPAVLSWRWDNPVRRSKRWRVLGNRVHDVWGECLDALYLDDADFVGNTVSGCYSASLYVDNGRALRLEKNRIAATDARYDRAVGGQRAHGITLATESADVGCENTGGAPACPLEDIRIANNVITGTTVGILYWHKAGTPYAYRRLTLAHNVVFAPVNESVYVGGANGVAVGPATVENNVFYGGRGGSPLWVGDAGVWAFQRNVYPSGRTPTVGNHGDSFVADPAYASVAIDAPADAFRPKTGSPLVGAGAKTAVRDDYACQSRPEKPTIGAFESTAP